MSDPAASPTPPVSPNALPPNKPPPLTRGQKMGFTASLIAGIAILIVGTVFVDDSVPFFLQGAIIGGGCALAVMGFMMLFYRPDRGRGTR